MAPNAGGGSGTFGQVNLNATWQFNISGAYQLPLGFTVAGNYFGRQGYPIALTEIVATPTEQDLAPPRFVTVDRHSATAGRTSST